MRVRVTGRVQGVGFRYSTQARAAELGVAGWVRNSRDGAVELLAVGSDAAVAALLLWLHDGPPLARVDDVAVQDADTPLATSHQSFRIVS